MQTYSWELDGNEATVIAPENPVENRFWIWRAEFLGAFDYADQVLLKMGWHIAYYKLPDMYGAPSAINKMKDFHDCVTERFRLNPKADMFGFSRGGLYAANYTLRFPEDVSSLYLDAPVLDIKSWPAGYGAGICSQREWTQCKDIYGLTEESAKDFAESPIDRVDALIQTKVPVILVAGDSDEAVPLAENGGRLIKAYEESGIPTKAIIKQGAGHHPHSLAHPEEIVTFIVSHRSYRTENG